jgi:threonine/homoserine/homoserine lactone efflux protein
VIEIIFNGIKFGIVLSFLIGPVFFTILQTSVERGFWVGVLVAIGVSLSDILYVAICYFGLSSFLTNPGMKSFMGYSGGGILIAFGLYHLIIKSRQKNLTHPGRVRESKPMTYVAKGFLINAMSPMVPIFWIGAVSIATIDLEYTSMSKFGLFFCGVLVTVLATDIGKAYLSDKLRRLITHRSLMIMNVIVGTALIVFGGRLILVALNF